ncbi:hypothetical protein RRG08_041132 [Elysia crispata]|uniref:Uncharacterized protein n=1 Tax=Elysia crispata TaxID=231223 RepID=A0AAE0XZ67_9GAST|nr:hypothetical protein RRG08_041132 [Elysia crispata]
MHRLGQGLGSSLTGSCAPWNELLVLTNGHLSGQRRVLISGCTYAELSLVLAATLSKLFVIECPVSLSSEKVHSSNFPTVQTVSPPEWTVPGGLRGVLQTGSLRLRLILIEPTGVCSSNSASESMKSSSVCCLGLYSRPKSPSHPHTAVLLRCLDICPWWSKSVDRREQLRGNNWLTI